MFDSTNSTKIDSKNQQYPSPNRQTGLQATHPKISPEGLHGTSQNTVGNLIIGEGVTMTGKISNAINVEIYGQLIGEVHTRNLITGVNSRIEGVVEAESAKVQGEITKEIKISGLLHLESTAILNGHVEVGELSAITGSRVMGTISMKV